MLKRHPTLKHVLGRAGWYFITFLVAVTINFFLPRLGDANPVDTIMARSSGNLDQPTAREKEDAYLAQFGLAVVDENGKVVRVDGKPVKRPLAAQFATYVGMSLQGDLGTSILQYPK